MKRSFVSQTLHPITVPMARPVVEIATESVEQPLVILERKPSLRVSSKILALVNTLKVRR